MHNTPTNTPGVKVTDALSEAMGLRTNGMMAGADSRRDKSAQQEAVRRAGLRACRETCCVFEIEDHEEDEAPPEASEAATAPATGYEQEAAPAMGYKQEAAPETGYEEQEASPATGYELISQYLAVLRAMEDDGSERHHTKSLTTADQHVQPEATEATRPAKMGQLIWSASAGTLVWDYMEDSHLSVVWEDELSEKLSEASATAAPAA